MKQTSKLAAIMLLAAGLFAACKPEIDLVGSAWSNSVTATDEDGDRYTSTYTLVCNSASGGMLFVSADYGDQMPLCFAMPFTYTWDGDQGTVTATFSHPEIGTKTFSIPLTWSKTTGLQAAFTSMEQYIEIAAPLELEKKSYANPSSMDGTVWTLSISEDNDGWAGPSRYEYELKFVSTTAAILNLTMTGAGENEDSERWNISYSYSDGIGTTTLTADGMTIRGGFYMPDDSHLLFSDGENGLLMTKQ